MNESTPLNVRQVFGSRLGYTSRRWRGAVDERLRPFGLTEATWLPLLYISRAKKPLRQKDLAETVGIESSTLVRLVDALVQAGFIERRTDEDRRAKVLCLTPRGRAVVKRVEAATATIRQQILSGISDKELAITLDVMERICSAFNQSHTSESEDET